MNPVTKAIAAGLVRLLMVGAGAYGVDLGNDQIETIVDALLILVPAIWSVINKLNVHETIKDAKAGLL